MTINKNEIINFLSGYYYNGHISDFTNLSDIFDVDELAPLELQTEIHKQYKVDIEPFMHDIKTVGDLCDLIEFLVSKNKNFTPTRKEKMKKQKITYNQFVESAKKILVKNSNNLNINKLALTVNLVRDLGMDSLDLVELAHGLEKQYNFYIPNELFQKMKSLNFGEISSLAYKYLIEQETKRIAEGIAQNQMVR